MKTFRAIYDQAYQTALLNAHGYRGPETGADGHKTFTNRTNNDAQILLDLPGNEWHLMYCGVVQTVGKLNDNSLDDLVYGKITSAMETEENENLNWQEKSDLAQERLHKQRIYEPDGGTSSASDNASSSDGMGHAVSSNV